MSHNNFSCDENLFSSQEILELAENIAAKFSDCPQVVAIARSGSQSSQASDDLSDLDLYVYTQSEISLDTRTKIAQEFATRIEINNSFWEPGDEWIDNNSGSGVDIMYRTPNWIESQLDRVLIRYQASVGYSTCFWWNVLMSKSLYDRDGWFRQLQEKAKQPYPEPLRRAIVAKNYPILRNNISSYTHQIELAINRGDFVSINHRITALLASYFDIIFAVNYVPHPGEKRLVDLVKKLCKKLPNHIETHVSNVVNAISLSSNQDIINHINKLLDELDELLIAEELILG